MNAKLSKLFFAAVFLFNSLLAISQIIEPGRAVDWKSAYNGFNPIFPTLQINILDFGALGDGITDDHQAISDAISSLEDEGGTIYFPPGNYLINSPINFSNDIVFKGQGADSTILIFDLGGQALNCINISKAQTTNFISVSSGFTKESNKLYCPDCEDLEKGDFAEIIQDNGNWDIAPADWAQNTVGQIIRVEDVLEDTIWFNNPLRIEYSEDLNPRIRSIIPIQNCGIECLKIKRIDEPEEGAGSNINFSFAANCLIRGVESDSSVGSHISVYHSTNIWFTGNYIHHAFTYDGAGTRGYGIQLSQHSGECYIADNIFRHLRHSMMVKSGANGNVFAYNYSLEPNRSEPIPTLSGDISLHGHFAYSNLFEGNIVQNIIIDHYWGPSGPWNTMLRNRAELFGILMTENEEYETSYQNFVGNETSNIITPYGQFITTGNNHFKYGNNIRGNAVPEGSEDFTDTSYYLSGQPPFWTSEYAWPPIGYPNKLDEFTIPAKQRFLDGDYTLCNDSTVSGIGEKIRLPVFNVWPNPASEKVFFKLKRYEDLDISIYDAKGRRIYHNHLNNNLLTQSINISFIKQGGIYLIVVRGRKWYGTAKMFVNN